MIIGQLSYDLLATLTIMGTTVFHCYNTTTDQTQLSTNQPTDTYLNARHISVMRCWCQKPNGQMSCDWLDNDPDSKVHGTNMGPNWDRQGPGGTHVGPMYLAIRGYILLRLSILCYMVTLLIAFEFPWKFVKWWMLITAECVAILKNIKHISLFPINDWWWVYWLNFTQSEYRNVQIVNSIGSIINHVVRLIKYW